MNKQIQKLKEGCGSYIENDVDGNTEIEEYDCDKLHLCPTCQVKLQTWKQALNLQLKDVEKDIEWLGSSSCKNAFSLSGYSSERKQKLAKKQKDKDEIIKELGEMK